MNDIIERMRSGKRISETDSDFPRLCEEVENTKRLVGELNTGYHAPDEVWALLERIWGQPLDASVQVFPPYYTAFGKTTRVGKGVFINFGCTFLDQGDITLEEGVFIGRLNRQYRGLPSAQHLETDVAIPPQQRDAALHDNRQEMLLQARRCESTER